MPERHRIVKRMDSGMGNLVNNIDERLPKDSSDADWLVPVGVFVAAMLLIAVVFVSVKWCISRNKYKYLNSKEMTAPPDAPVQAVGIRLSVAE